MRIILRRKGKERKMRPHEDTSFFSRAVGVMRSIPKGKVATYGLVATLAGNRRAAREVAYILHSSSEKHGLPWHRVVNSKGGISLKPGHGYEDQKMLLEKEGVIFRDDGTIDLKRFMWQPHLTLENDD
jgi:methylated-DNA-protein-cysteine methyltransferase-like protein